MIWYVSALLELQDILIKKIESGELEYSTIEQMKIIELSEVGVKHININHYGAEFQLKEIPNPFKFIDVIRKDGFTGRTIYPGCLRHNYLMLETGIRGKQLLWLDEATYAQFMSPDTSDEYLQTLYVNTNKDGCSWHASVSNRVVSILKAQCDWKNDIDCDGYLMSLDYSTSNPDAYDKIYPIFSFNTYTGYPFTLADYSLSWQKMLLGFQWFLQENDIDQVYYVKYMPKNIKGDIHNLWNPSIPSVQKRLRGYAEVEVTQDGYEYCPVVLRVLVSPHGARGTVVSESVTVLPPEYVGKYITGQNVRAVNYYTKPDKDRVRNMQKR